MLIILPMFAFFLILLFSSLSVHDFRKSWIIASLGIFTTVALTTEFLSKLGQITPFAITSFWTLLTGVLMLLVGSKFSKIELGRILSGKEAKSWWILKVILLVFLINLLVLGLNSSPNNWDSMTYHLGRIMHWIQNQNLEFYPTNIMRQLNFPPFAEILMMHVYLLTGNDRMMNVIQWFSFVSIVLTISLIYDELESGKNKGRFITAVLAATIPMAILQASGTQNDILTSYLVTIAVWRFLKLAKRNSFGNLLVFALSVSLALYTKTTSYIYLAPLLAGTAFLYLKKPDIMKILLHATVFLTVIIAVNGSHYARNYSLWRNPFGVDNNDIHLNSRLDVKYMFSNTIRNVLMQFQSPNKYLNDGVYSVVKTLHSYLDISPDDKNDTFTGEEFDLSEKPYVYHPDYAPNPLHMGVIVITSIVFLVFGGKRRKQILYFGYGLSTLLLFSLLLKWQPWNSRLLLPFFFIFCPLAATVLQDLPGKVVTAILVAVIVIAVPYIFNNEIRPLIGTNSVFKTERYVQYFNGRKDILISYVSSARAIKQSGCKEIGLNLNPDDYEYPIWVLLRNEGVTIRHYGVSNFSRVYYKNPKFTNFEPCAVINPIDRDGTVAVDIYKK